MTSDKSDSFGDKKSDDNSLFIKEYFKQRAIEKSKRINNIANHPYLPSQEDRLNLTEISLPFSKFQEKLLEEKNKKITQQWHYRLGIWGKIIRVHSNPKTFSAVVYLKPYINPQGKVSDFDLIRLKDGKALGVAKSHKYQGQEYQPNQISYDLRGSREFWEELTYQINFFAMKDEASKYHLSIFIDENSIKESNYTVKNSNATKRYIEKKDESIINLPNLEISIEVKKFEISEGIYWLKEAGDSIEFEWLIDSKGRFGCIGNKMYPIKEKRALATAKFIKSHKFYEFDTPNQVLGDIALNNVKLALEKLEGLTVWEAYGDADTIYKWDLFFKINSTVYPLQIKSSFGEAQKALRKYEQENLPFIPPIVWINPVNSEEKARKLVDDLSTRFVKILDAPLSSNKDVSPFFLEEKSRKIRESRY